MQEQNRIGDLKSYKVLSSETGKSANVSENDGEYAVLEVGNFYSKRTFKITFFGKHVIDAVKSGNKMPDIDGRISFIKVAPHYRTNPRTGKQVVDDQGNPVVYDEIVVFTTEDESPLDAARRQLRMYTLATEGGAGDATNSNPFD